MKAYRSLFAAFLVANLAPAYAADTSSPCFSVSRVNPKYPRVALEQGANGNVTLRFAIDRSGHVDRVKVKTSTPAGMFDQAAIDAVREWRYRPCDGTEFEKSFVQEAQLRFKLDP